MKELTVLHVCYSTNITITINGTNTTIIVNGASFIQFSTGPLQYERRAVKDSKPVGGITIYQQEPVSIAFLKRRTDGRFEPVPGHLDSAISFREVHKPSLHANP